MKKLLLSILLISFLSTFSQDSCVVKIFPGDCRNCYIGMENIKSCNESIKKTIVFPDISKAEVKSYLENILNISDIDKYNVIVSDSVYNSINKNLSSEICIYKENKLYNQSLLKNFYGFAELGPFEILIPDSIAISIESTIINHEDYFFITDSKFGNCIFISKHGDHKITILSSKDFTTELIFNKITGDTSCYHIFSKYREVLKSANMDKVQFKHTFGKTHMSAFIMIPNIELINNEAGLTYKTGIIIFDNPKDYTTLSIKEESLPENYLNYSGFYSEYNGNYYMQLAHMDRNIDDQYLLGKFFLEDEELIFSGFPKYKTPKEYLPASKFKSLRKVMMIAYPYIFLQYSLSYYDANNNQTYLLPFDSINLEFEFPDQVVNLLKFEHSYKFIDAYISDQILQILYKESDRYFIAYINTRNRSLIKTLDIINPTKRLKTGMSFYSADKLFYLASDNTIVVEDIKLR